MAKDERQMPGIGGAARVHQELRYEIIEKLGQGGFGTVYRARLLGEGGFTKEVALKVLNDDLSETSEVAQRLRDEARILGLVRHRAIVQVDQLIQLAGRWAVVMEYVEGADLQQIIRYAALPAGPALELVAEVAGALHAAWGGRGPDGRPLALLHRDVKPSNIQLTALGEVKLLDFGIARAEFASREAITSAHMYGSVAYMAPERFHFREGPEGDIYSLGVVLYEAIAGRPFGRSPSDPVAHRRAIEEKLEALRAARPAQADGLIPLLRDLLAREPEARPAAREVESRCADLRRGLAGPSLRDWAEVRVPAMRAQSLERERDGLTGQIISTPSTTAPPPIGATPEATAPAPAQRAAAPQTLERPAEPPAPDGPDPGDGGAAPISPTPLTPTPRSPAAPSPASAAPPALALFGVAAAGLVAALVIGGALVAAFAPDLLPRGGDAIGAAEPPARADAEAIAAGPEVAAPDIAAPGSPAASTAPVKAPEAAPPTQAASAASPEARAATSGTSGDAPASAPTPAEAAEEATPPATGAAGGPLDAEDAAEAGPGEAGGSSAAAATPTGSAAPGDCEGASGCYEAGAAALGGGDAPSAAAAFDRACEAGSGAGCAELAALTDEGQVVPQSSARALALYEQACALRHASACASLGRDYELGRRGVVDLAVAASFFRRGCDAGGAGACTSLGLLYSDGRGVAQDAAVARGLFEQACASGDKLACVRAKR